MAKTRRGKALWNLPSHGRGTCPVCKRSRIKLLYNHSLPEGGMVKVCKYCRHKHSAG